MHNYSHCVHMTFIVLLTDSVRECVTQNWKDGENTSAPTQLDHDLTHGRYLILFYSNR